MQDKNVYEGGVIEQALINNKERKQFVDLSEIREIEQQKILN